MKYYSESTKGFFDSEIHKNIPDDGIVLTDDEYIAILEEQSTGRNIRVRNGKVVTEEYVPTQEEIDNAYKNRRKANYPTITDQLDMLWHLMDREEIPGKGTDWYNTLLDVKTKYPKP